MEPTPIALCITDLDVGGAERCLAELATRVDRQRFEPVVCCLSPPPKPPTDALLAMLQRAEVTAHFLDARHFWQFPAVVGRLKRLLAAYQPRLVQTFLFHANIVGRIAARRAGVPRVSCGLRVAEPRRWHLWLDRRTQGKVDRYVCVSRSVADHARVRGGLPAEKLVVIPNGLDLVGRSTTASSQGRSGTPFYRRLVTFVGRLDRQKGLSWLLETAPAWLAKLPDSDLFLVGEGPLRAALEQQCQRLGIADRVCFAGFRADVPEILARSDLLVLPSAWEGMPNAVLEAMAAGLPVVATNVEGVDELLGPLAGVQTVRYGDTESLVEKVVVFMRDRQFAVRTGAENRRRVEAEFSISRTVKAYENLWESLLAE
jgi:glycosyltransferase involved in cell wall biosynthesis